MIIAVQLLDEDPKKKTEKAFCIDIIERYWIKKTPVSPPS